MASDLEDYLLRRIDRPLAWVVVFGLCLAVAGAVVGYEQQGIVGAIELGLASLVAGTLVGAILGGAVWLACRFVGGLDCPVRRPDLWALHLQCSHCSWKTTPEGPWTIRNCMIWPGHCPDCAAPVTVVVPDCPRCGSNQLSGTSLWHKLRALFRRPQSSEQALWGHYTCRNCAFTFDKWGRPVT